MHAPSRSSARTPAGAPEAPDRVPEPLELRVDVSSLVKVLAAVVVVLWVLGGASAAVRLAGYPTAFGFVNLFNLDIESSAPTWFSAMVLLACATVLVLLAVDARRRGDRRRTAWVVLAVGFVAMSIDDVAGYHESWVDRLRDLFDTGGIFYFAWVIPGSILVALLAVGFVPFLRSLPRATTVRFLVAGATFLAGALGMEMVNGWWVERNGGESHTYAAMVGLEELLEMAGAIAFLRALLLHLATRRPSVAIDLTCASSRG